MKPYLTKEVISSDGHLVRATKPQKYGVLLSESEAKVLTDYMVQVVQSGTAKKLRDMDVKVAGKTGTAEFDMYEKPHAWFVGFAPADHPTMAFAILVESAGGGSTYAVPIAKKLIEAYIQ